MHILNYTVEGLGTVAVREQAIESAKLRATHLSKAVMVTAHLDHDRRDRSIQVNPDGSIVKLWKEEM